MTLLAEQPQATAKNSKLPVQWAGAYTQVVYCERLGGREINCIFICMAALSPVHVHSLSC